MAGYLSDGSILIRPFRIRDPAPVYEAIQESVAHVSPWMPDLNSSLSRADVAAWIETRPEAWATGIAYNFAIIDAEDGTFLGGCGLSHIHRTHRFANLFYWVRSSQTGRGVATAATRLLARFGFDELALIRIEIVVAVDNQASLRVAEKAGAMQEGILRNRVRLHGKVHDAVMFSLIPEDL